ncbi:MAG: hypothetical protein ACRC0A_03260, partial [Chitinophagaceae bacterium]
MKLTIKNIYFYLLIIFYSTNVVAQIHNPIEIYSDFKPTINRQIEKLPFTPNTIRFNNLKIDSITYLIDTTAQHYHIQVKSVRPKESLPEDTIIYRNYQYLKGGYGMYNTSYLFAHLSFIDVQNVGLYGLGQLTGMKTKKTYQNYLNFNLGSELWMEGTNKIRFFAKFNYETSNYRPNKDFLNTIDTSIMRIIDRNYIDVQLGFEPRKDVNNRFNIRPIVGYKGFTTDSIKREQFFYAESPLLWNIDHRWKIGLKPYFCVYTYTNDVKALATTQIGSFSFEPYGSFTDTFITATVGIPMYIINNKFTIFPSASITYPVSRKYNTILFANIKGEQFIQTYYSLTQQAPWLFQTLSNFVASKMLYEVGVDQIFFKTLNIKFHLGYRQDKNLVLLLNNYEYQNFLKSEYESQLERLITTIDASYTLKKILRIGTTASFNSILSQKTFDHPYGIPLINIKAYAVYEPVKNLTFNISVDGWGKIYYKDLNQIVKQLPFVADLSIETVYKITPNIMLWLMLKNILNSKEQRYYTYE